MGHDDRQLWYPAIDFDHFFRRECNMNTEDKAKHILIIDDDAVDARLLARFLEGLDLDEICWTHAASEPEAIEYLSSKQIDLVFLDYYLGEVTGIDILKSIRRIGFLGPVIIQTNHRDEYVAKDLIRAGADDFIVKQDMTPDFIRRTITNATAQYARRKAEFEHQLMFVELQAAKSLLEERNRNLQSLYQTAHQFVDNVSHEFRTPLTVIKEFASIIRDGLAGEVTDEQAEYLEIIDNRVDNLSIMVDDMLDISKLEAGLLGVGRVDLCVDDIFEELHATLDRKARSAKINVVYEVADPLPQIFGDPEKIGRILINLVVNAIKFSDEGGIVTVKVEDISDEHCVRFSVTDRGPGISEERVKSLFQRFNQVGGGLQASAKGFGLGLNIAKELVHLNFGDISVQSVVGVGSTFSFTIPHSDRPSLIRRYLRKQIEQRNGPVKVTLAHIMFESALSVDLLECVERMMQQNSRSNDLIIRVGECSWVLVSLSTVEQPDSVFKRIERALSEFRDDPQEQDIPDWTLNVKGSWLATGPMSPVVDEFLKLAIVKEMCHA